MEAKNNLRRLLLSLILVPPFIGLLAYEVQILAKIRSILLMKGLNNGRC
jgi:hypothetical protein